MLFTVIHLRDPAYVNSLLLFENRQGSQKKKELARKPALKLKTNYFVLLTNQFQS